jgi:hypothetical protein
VQVGACISGSRWFHPVATRNHKDKIFFFLVGSRETSGLVLSTSCNLLKKRF